MIDLIPIQCIGYCPKPRLYGVLETEGYCIIAEDGARGDYATSRVVSNSRRAEAWVITGLDYGAYACGAVHLWSAIVHPVARLPISCVSVVLWVVA